MLYVDNATLAFLVMLGVVAALKLWHARESRLRALVKTLSSSAAETEVQLAAEKKAHDKLRTGDRLPKALRKALEKQPALYELADFISAGAEVVLHEGQGREMHRLMVVKGDRVVAEMLVTELWIVNQGLAAELLEETFDERVETWEG